ncbi:MAG: DVU0298 family protein [Acidobacteriota bacterium]
MKIASRSHRQAKGRLRGLLAARDHPQLLAWAAGDPGVMGLLTSLLFEPDELIVWRAIEGLGKAAGLRAESDLESVRDLLRRFIWAMNDESGSLIWRAPEAMGETLANVTALVGEYGTILASYLREEPFERGVHWAIARIAGLAPATIAESLNELVRSLSMADPYLRAHAGIALATLGAKRPALALLRLAHDPAQLTVYDFTSGLLRTSTVGREVQGALSQSDGRS